MKVGQRLFIAVIPAVLGVLLVAALAWYGQYAHTAPAALVLLAAIAAIASLAMAWRNTRYVALRLERMAGQPSATAHAAGDELESLERVVASVDDEQARMARVQRERQELGDMLVAAADSAARSIDEIRLPLHILLENRFGDLNENQEEMLGAARAAADQAAERFAQLHLVAQLDAGAMVPRRDPVRVDELVSPVLASLGARAEERGVHVRLDLPPALPRVAVDRTHVQQALALLLDSALSLTAPGSELAVSALRSDERITLIVHHGGAVAADGAADRLVTRHLLAGLGARLEEHPGETRVAFPVASPSSMTLS